MSVGRVSRDLHLHLPFRARSEVNLEAAGVSDLSPTERHIQLSTNPINLAVLPRSTDPKLGSLLVVFHHATDYQMSYKILPHGLPKALADNVWQVKGSLSFPLPRYMSIIRLDNGNLLLYSVVAMNEAGMTALEHLGRPTHMIVPHPWHIMDSAFYKERYPNIVVIAESDGRDAIKDHVKVDGAPEMLSNLGVRYHMAKGSRYQEIVLDVDTKDGRALLFTDLFACNGPDASLLVRLAGPPGGSGTPRLVRFRQVVDKAALKIFFEELADLPNVHIVAGCHGLPITSDGSRVLRHAAFML